MSSPLDLQITILSVESPAIPANNKKSSVHVAVHAGPPAREASTTADVVKGESLQVSVPMEASHVAFEVRVSWRSFIGRIKKETIGIANVAVSDLVEGHVASDFPRLLSYRLRDRDGESGGIVNFSVRVKGLDGGKWGPPMVSELGGRWWRQNRHQEDGGVVIGIPAAWCL